MAEYDSLTLERFWAKVQKKGPDECWPWTGGMIRGYGVFTVPKAKQRNRRASRFSFELSNGPIPEGLCVCHRCDNPPCVNPSHLFLATNRENTADKVRKKRHLFGEKHLQAKLTQADVLAIRASSERTGVIAARYGIHRTTALRARIGERWAHL